MYTRYTTPIGRLNCTEKLGIDTTEIRGSLDTSPGSITSHVTDRGVTVLFIYLRLLAILKETSGQAVRTHVGV